MRTFVDLEKIIWRTSKVFVFGNPYNVVVASKPIGLASSTVNDESKWAVSGGRRPLPSRDAV
jgi:hypothetical protein